VVRLIADDAIPKGLEMTSEFDTDILGHYNEGIEQDRLFGGRSQLELVRTQELLTRHLPPPPVVVLDVGGGPGVYAAWLTGLGYEVHLVDPVPLHVEQAQGADPTPASATVGDARRLDWPDQSVDVVLLLGPLYHLTEREDRLQALREAHRVLRPGGVVFVTAISRFASLFDGLALRFLEDPEFAHIVEQDLRDGQHRNPSNKPGYFTTAFFHHPDELQAEVREAGFDIFETVSIEGPAWCMVRQDFPAMWDDPVWRERLLASSRAVEHEPTLLGLGPHLMVVARKA
jgi:ubiquinone/menaquinone biosynthesis C-methylase UbiE